MYLAIHFAFQYVLNELWSKNNNIIFLPIDTLWSHIEHLATDVF